MPTTPVTPYVPQYITVHLGAPSAAAENVTVSFPEYVKNVASSEIYPTWEPAAIRANILAIISFALNRVYTEYYPSRGYPFNITASTAYDQKFIYGRNIYSNIDRLVDSIFANYLSRPGVRQPIFTSYCDGNRVSCQGLSQWGSKYLGDQGYSAIEIIRYYYGNDMYINAAQAISGVPSVFALIGTIQEETHRFAITYQRALRSRRMKKSGLEDIPGIGEKRRQALLKKFRSVKAISQAERSQLEQVLPASAALAVYQHFHPKEGGQTPCASSQEPPEASR